MTVEELIAHVGGPTPEPEEEKDPPEQETPADQEPDNAEPEGNVEETPAEPEAQPAPPADDKAQQAFIHMRKQNKQYADTFKGIAELVGVEGDLSDEQALLTALQEKVTENEAKKNHIPVDVLQRLKQLEERDAEYTALQNQQKAALGFETVKKDYGLDQTALNEFASTLVKSGKDPFDPSIDLVAEYKLLHFEDILAKQVQEAVAAEQQRAASASEGSSTPGNTNGGNTNTESKKINTQEDLTKWLGSLS